MRTAVILAYVADNCSISRQFGSEAARCLSMDSCPCDGDYAIVRNLVDGSLDLCPAVHKACCRTWKDSPSVMECAGRVLVSIQLISLQKRTCVATPHLMPVSLHHGR